MFGAATFNRLAKVKEDNSTWKDSSELSDETFLVLSNRFGKVYIHRCNSAKSLWLLGPTHPLRKYLIYLTTNQYFELFIILTILTNCVILALNDPPEEAEYVFAVIYTLETIFKIIARGFILGQLTYLRDPWNWLDFSVVILGYVTIAPGVDTNLSGIRTFRVLRALRTISAIESLRRIVNTLLRSMRMLVDVLVLTLFFICVFALIGLQVFGGRLRSRCVLTDVTLPNNSSWWHEIRKRDNWYDESLVCGNNSGSMKCPRNYSCLQHVGDNPNYGYTNYDNFGWSLLTSFQLLSLDFWEDVYFHILSAVGPWCIVYFVFVIFYGAFLVVNLMLAVVALSYEQETFGSKNNEEMYQRLSEVIFPYSLNSRIIPRLVFGGPVLNIVNTLATVKRGANMIIIPKEELRKATKLLVDDRNVLRIKTINANVVRANQRSVDIGTIDITDNENPRNGEYSQISQESDTLCNLSNAIEEGKPVKELSSLSRKSHASSKNTSCKDSWLFYKTHCIQTESKEETHTVSETSTVSIIRIRIYKTVTHSFFEPFVVVLILLNAMLLAMEHHGMSKKFMTALNNGNRAFLLCFFVELLLKLTAFGVKGYLSSRWNIFDGIIVIVGIIDFIIEMSADTDKNDMTMIRALRLFRVLRIANAWPAMKVILSSMARSIKSLANLTFILAIILYMFAVVGTQVFAQKYKANNFPTNEVPDWNFKNFGHSFLVIFRVLCGEWIELLYDCMLVSGSWAPIFFITALICGNFMILNLFLALLLGSLTEQASEEYEKTVTNTKLKWSNATKILNIMRLKETVSAFTNAALLGTDISLETFNVKNEADVNNSGSVSFIEETSRSPTSKSHSPTCVKKVSCLSSNSASRDMNDNDCERNVSATYSRRSAMKSTLCKEWTRLRVSAKTLIQSKWFDHGIMLMIIASSFMLVFEDIHLPERPKLRRALKILDVFFCIIFSIEFILKVVAMGVLSYIRNGWNVLDFVVLIASIISIFSSNNNFKTLRSIRTVRALRPLRAVQRWNGIKIILTSLIKAIPSIANVLLVCLMAWTMFSILGVQLFGGKFYKCIDASGDRINADLIPNRTACIRGNLTWQNSHVNFDNVIHGLLALLQVATFEGWIEVIRDAVDATEVDMQPIKQSHPFAYVYFIVFIIIGSFVIMNLFISVLIDSVYAIKKHQDDYGSAKIFLSAQQKQWLSTITKSLMKKPKRFTQRPSNYYHGKVFDVVSSSHFEIVVTLLICLNFVLMTLQHYNQPHEYQVMLLAADTAFTTLFCVEIILKLLAFRKYIYIDIWNMFDLVIMIFSLADIIVRYSNDGVDRTLTFVRALRILRIGRSLRFFNKTKGIQRLIRVLYNSSASVIHMATLLFLLMFIYSIVGMTNFGGVKKTGVLNEIVNFETFGNSILLLIRASTSAGWNDVLDALMIQPPECNDDHVNPANSDCGVVWIAVTYFTTYIFLSLLVVLNMHVAIILENFNDAYNEEESGGVTDHDLEMFYDEWQLYDPLATQFISFDDVSSLVGKLAPPLGIPLPNRIAVHNLDLPLDEDDNVHCTNLLQTLVRRINEFSEETECDEVRRIIEQKRWCSFPVLQGAVKKTTSMIVLREQRSASIIQRNYRSFRRRKESVITIQRHYRKYRGRCLLKKENSHAHSDNIPPQASHISTDHA